MTTGLMGLLGSLKFGEITGTWDLWVRIQEVSRIFVEGYTTKDRGPDFLDVKVKVEREVNTRDGTAASL